MMTDDPKSLLRDFSRNHSEEAFRALVRQHSPVVYGTALRKLGGNRAAAQDVTQEVFTLLARKAPRLESVVLGGWLYRQTCRRAANHVRTESRRKQRETLAMESLATSTSPAVAESLAGELDDALLALSEKDRDALVLRFFEGKEFKRVGCELGLTEDAARKRVTRALERLAGNLKRKGITAGTLALGQTMAGYGRTEVPSSLASRLTEIPLRAGATSPFLSALSFVMPVVAGVVVTSVVAGSLPSSEATVSRPPIHSTGPETRRIVISSDFAKELSLEEMLVELRRTLSKPRHALTSLQLSVLLEGIGISRTPDFILLANERMTAAERASIYQRLLEKWLAADPKAAMDFVLSENIGKQVDPQRGTNLLNNLFETLARTDRGGGEAWLLENWENPVLSAEAFQGTLRNFLMVKLVEERFAHEGVASVFELIGKLPPGDQAAALDGLTGRNPWTESWRRGNPRKWMELHHAIQQFPDVGLRRELSRNFWTSLGSERPDEVRELMRAADPMDRFQISLGWLGVNHLPGEMTPTLAGYTQRSIQVTDHDQREAAALAAGLAAGLTRAQVLSEIGRVLIDQHSGSFFQWLDAHQGQVDLDDEIAAQVRKLANSNVWTTGGECVAVEWARRISDDDLRSQLSRGAFRMALSRSPDAALAYATSADLPSDLAAEFESILTGTP